MYKFARAKIVVYILSILYCISLKYQFFSIFLRTKFRYKIGCSIKLQPYSISFLLKVNFDKFTIGSHLLRIFFILAKFVEN